jgi:hypothetical protein
MFPISVMAFFAEGPGSRDRHDLLPLFLAAHPEHAEQERTGPPGFARVFVVRTVAKPPRTRLAAPAETWQRQSVRFFVLRHLGQWMSWFARFVPRGSHLPIMPED